MYRRDTLLAMARTGAQALLGLMPLPSTKIIQSIHVLAFDLKVRAIDRKQAPVAGASVRFVDTGLDYVGKSNRAEGTILLGMTQPDGSLAAQGDYRFCRLDEGQLKPLNNGTFEIHIHKQGQSPVSVSYRFVGLRFERSTRRYIVDMGDIVLP